MNDEDEELIERWFDIKNVSSGTQKNYRIGLRYYVELTGKTPTELIEEAETQEANNIIPRKRNINNYLIKFKRLLMDKVAPATVNLYFYSVRSFYRAFFINLPDINLPTFPQYEHILFNVLYKVFNCFWVFSSLNTFNG